jgi:hypothetical protein
MKSPLSPGAEKTEEERIIEGLYFQEMGFSMVVDMLIEAKRPIVGHNMIYDIIYLYN